MSTEVAWRGREVGAMLGATGVGLAAVVALGHAGWPGEPFDCLRGACYCEQARAGLVRQPGNTWSNAGALLVALAVAVQAARGRLDREAAGRSEPGADALGLLFPVVLVFQGIGSMLFHGGLTVWGAALDAMSMFAVVGLLVATNLHRLGLLQRRGVLVLFGGMMVGGCALGFVSMPAVVHSVYVLFFVILGTEGVLSHAGRSPSRGWFRAGLGVYVGASAVWFLSAAPGLPLCNPSSPWQGHGLWHVAAAAAVGLFAQHTFRNLGRCAGLPAWPRPAEPEAEAAPELDPAEP